MVRDIVSSYLQRGIASWRQRRTRNLISRLPAEIQKDIGWPDGTSRMHMPAQNFGWKQR